MKTIKKLLSNQYVQITATVLLAFAAAYMLMPQNGVWATLPVCLVCALITALVGKSVIFSAAVFGVMTYLLTSFSVSDVEYSVISALFAVLTLLAAVGCVWLIKKRRVLHVICAVAVAAAACALHFWCFGSPIDAFSARDKLYDYADRTYDDTVHVGNLRYDRKNGGYFCEIYGSNAVTEVRTLYYFGSSITDNYRGFAERSVMRDARQSLQNALREAFPNGKFDVVPHSSGEFPSEGISVAAQLENVQQMSFDINVSTALDPNSFASLAKSYIFALGDRNLHPARLTVRGGGVDGYYVSVTSLYTSFMAPTILTYTPDDVYARYVFDFMCKSTNIPAKMLFFY